MRITDDKLLCNLSKRNFTGFCFALGIAETSAEVEGKVFGPGLSGRARAKRPRISRFAVATCPKAGLHDSLSDAEDTSMQREGVF
jgi:hypothetical protein